MKWCDLTLNAADLAGLETRYFAADQVSQVFAVPSRLLGPVSVRTECQDWDLLGLALDRLGNQGEL